MTTTFMLVFVLSLALPQDAPTPIPPATQPAHQHDAEHAHAEEPALPPLTKDEAIRLADEARKNHLQRRLDALADYAAAARSALNTLADADRAAAALIERIERDAQAIREGRYVSTAAGEEDVPPVAALAEQHTACALRMDQADQAYLDALRQILARDPEGFVGQRLTEHLQKSVDILLMSQLMDFYWHNGQLDDPPGSFDHIIRIGYRVLELEPKRPGAASTYGDVAWLLWSRWVSWKQDPEHMPVGEGDDMRALQLLERGSRENPDDAFYHFDAAMTLWGLAQYHDPKYFDFMLKALTVAETKAKDDAMRLRARMTLGHVYRKMKRFDDARHWYNQVLAMDPGNEIATRILAEEMVDPAATQPAP